MSKRILLITGDGGESFETWFALQRFQEAGYEAHVAAPTAAAPPRHARLRAGVGHL